MLRIVWFSPSLEKSHFSLPASEKLSGAFSLRLRRCGGTRFAGYRSFPRTLLLPPAVLRMASLQVLANPNSDLQRKSIWSVIQHILPLVPASCITCAAEVGCMQVAAEIALINDERGLGIGDWRILACFCHLRQALGCRVLEPRLLQSRPACSRFALHLWFRPFRRGS